MTDYQHFDMTYHITPLETRRKVADMFTRTVGLLSIEMRQAFEDDDMMKMSCVSQIMASIWGAHETGEVFHVARGLWGAWMYRDIKGTMDILTSEPPHFPPHVIESLDPIMVPLMETLEVARMESREYVKERMGELLDDGVEAVTMDKLAMKVLVDAGVDIEDDTLAIIGRGKNDEATTYRTCLVCGEMIFYDPDGIPRHVECLLHGTEHEKCEPDDEHIPGYREALKRATQAEYQMPGYL